MKILLLGDYSNYHACLGRALSQQGHEVTVASDGGGWMDTSRTLSLGRPFKGKAGGLCLFTKMLLDQRLKGFDIVSLINPSFVKLRPARLKTIFDRLKRKNGYVFLGSVGTDKAVMDFLTSPDCTLRYSEYFSSPGNIYQPNKEVLEKDCLWQRDEIGEFCEYVYDNVDGVTTALYEYHLAMERRFPSDLLAYAGIPIELPEKTDREEKRTGKINLFLGRHSARKKFKGTDRLEKAALRVVSELPDLCTFSLVEDQPYSVYLDKLNGADIVLDQLYSYSPATNALLAMADGKAVVSGGEPEFYDFIGEKDLKPIINAIPDDEALYITIYDAVQNFALTRKTAQAGREFVARHNDSAIVARRCLDFWTSKM